MTGGVGSGKSTALAYLRDVYDCEVMLADDIGLALEKKGEVCYQPLIDLMGEDIL